MDKGGQGAPGPDVAASLAPSHPCSWAWAPAWRAASSERCCRLPPGCPALEWRGVSACCDAGAFLLPLPCRPCPPCPAPPSPPPRERGWDIDIVCPVPDGSRPAAIQISAELQLPYREVRWARWALDRPAGQGRWRGRRQAGTAARPAGSAAPIFRPWASLLQGLVKNRYVGRTFIMPDQRMREVRAACCAAPAGRNAACQAPLRPACLCCRRRPCCTPVAAAPRPSPPRRPMQMSVRRKLNAMPVVFAGKSVLLIDDSIVRGTTMSQIVDMVRNAGAAKVRACGAARPGSAQQRRAAARGAEAAAAAPGAAGAMAGTRGGVPTARPAPPRPAPCAGLPGVGVAAGAVP